MESQDWQKLENRLSSCRLNSPYIQYGDAIGSAIVSITAQIEEQLRYAEEGERIIFGINREALRCKRS